MHPVDLRNLTLEDVARAVGYREESIAVLRSVSAYCDKTLTEIQEAEKEE